jgi:hypothetical protein
MEDLNLYLKEVLTERPHTRVPSADTVLRGIEELATENISYTAEKTGNVYDFNTAEKLNQLLIKLLLATGQLTEGGAYDVDFDHQFLEADKYDSKRTYKGFDGYSPGVFTIGGLIVYLENRDGNCNVRFKQAETHRRFFEMMSSFGIHVRSFRADQPLNVLYGLLRGDALPDGEALSHAVTAVLDKGVEIIRLAEEERRKYEDE